MKREAINNYPIKISKFKDNTKILNNLKFKISKLHKIDEHLYSFIIYHDSRKYVGFSDGLVCGSHYYIDILDSGEKGIDEVTPEDYHNGTLKEGHVKIKIKKPVHDLLFYYVPLKWETQVFLIVEHEDFDIWEVER